MAAIALVTFNLPPPRPRTLKYTHLAPACAAHLQAYAVAHGYELLDRPPSLQGAAACWGKFTALLQALEHHDCAVWVDSDALVRDPSRSLAPLLATDGDLLAQDPAPWFARTRLDPLRGLAMQPVNTGVFAVRRAGADLLRSALSRAIVEPSGEDWNGIGDQEALAVVITEQHASKRIGYVAGLQLPPGDPGASLFLHLFGDRAAYRFPPAACRAVIAKLTPRAASLTTAEAALLHWCAVQSQHPGGPDRGGPERFGYDSATLDHTFQACLDDLRHLA